jgi:Spy/CpxP family protein refolding chaperone
MRGIRCLVVAILAAGIVTMVAAQPGRQFGGFGQQDTYTLVLTNKALQEELKVTDTQKEKLKAAADNQKESMDKVRSDFKDKFADAGKDKDKRTEVFQAMNKETSKITADTRKKIDEILTSEQKTRLKQINVQVMGINVFADPEARMGGGNGGRGFGGGRGLSETDKATMKEVADTLKLTDNQKSKIKGLIEEYNKDRNSIRRDIFGDTKGKGGFNKGAFDPEKQKELRTKTEKLTTEVMGKIVDTFDATQKTAWKGLVGDAFDTSKLRPTFQPKKD